MASQVEAGSASPGTRLISLGLFDDSSTPTMDRKLARQRRSRSATGDSQEIKGEAKAAGQSLTHPAVSAASTAPRLAGTDVWPRCRRRRPRSRAPRSARDHVVLVTDGLSNTGCLDLSKVSARARVVLGAGLLPGASPAWPRCAVCGLRLYGVGRQAGTPPLTTAEQTWVENYWQNLRAASVSPRLPRAWPRPRPTTRGAPRCPGTMGPGDRLPRRPERATSLQVPADLLFAFNSATLSTAGRAYLDILLAGAQGAGPNMTR